MRILATTICFVVGLSIGTAFAQGTHLIAYFHGEWGNLNIYVIEAAGGLPIQLTQNAGNNLDPEWSPDGTRIAFQSDRDGYSAIYMMNVDGSEQVRVSPTHVDYRHPYWIPGGMQLLCTGPRGISVLDIDSGEVRLLASASVRGWNAKTSLEGSKIVFESDRDGDVEIFIINSDGTNVNQLTSNNIADQHPVISPDGTMIAFNSHASERQDFDLFIMSIDGTNVRRLTTASEHDEYASWSPDGQQLVYAYGNAALYIINADGTGNRRLTPTAFWTAGPSWQPTTHE